MNFVKIHPKNICTENKNFHAVLGSVNWRCITTTRKIKWKWKGTARCSMRSRMMLRWRDKRALVANQVSDISNSATMSDFSNSTTMSDISNSKDLQNVWSISPADICPFLAHGHHQYFFNVHWIYHIWSPTSVKQTYSRQQQVSKMSIKFDIVTRMP